MGVDGLRKVVVTGLGVISPVGNDVDTFWRALVSGTNGIGRIQAFDATGFPVQIAGEVKDFDATQWMDYKMARRSGKYAQFAVAAAKQALCSGKLEVNDEIAMKSA